MGRLVDPLVLGPPGVCDACGRYCCTLHEVGLPCFHCLAGVFIHRMFWIFSTCTFCATPGNVACQVCHGSRIMATPDEALDLAKLAAERGSYAARYRTEPLPPLIADLQIL